MQVTRFGELGLDVRIFNCKLVKLTFVVLKLSCIIIVNSICVFCRKCLLVADVKNRREEIASPSVRILNVS